MDKRRYSLVLPAAFIYFILLGFTGGQFFAGKVIYLFNLCFVCVFKISHLSLYFLCFACFIDFFWV